MDRKAWENRITEACRIAGTYLPQYEAVIETLARILETRDGALAEFEADGSKVTVRTEYRGAKVLKKHPAIAVAHECNQQALAYWKELGLTPSGFKKLEQGDSKKGGGFEELLSGLEI